MIARCSPWRRPARAVDLPRLPDVQRLTRGRRAPVAPTGPTYETRTLAPCLRSDLSAIPAPTPLHVFAVNRSDGRWRPLSVAVRHHAGRRVDAEVLTGPHLARKYPGRPHVVEAAAPPRSGVGGYRRAPPPALVAASSSPGDPPAAAQRRRSADRPAGDESAPGGVVVVPGPRPSSRALAMNQDPAAARADQGDRRRTMITPVRWGGGRTGRGRRPSSSPWAPAWYGAVSSRAQVHQADHQDQRP